MLVEPIPNEFMPVWDDRGAPHPSTVKTVLPLPRPLHFVYAPHFYDLNVLFFKSYQGMSVNVQGLGRGMFLLCALYFGTWGLFRKYVLLVAHTATFIKLRHSCVGVARRSVTCLS